MLLLKCGKVCPERVSKLARVSSRYAKVVGLIPSQGIYKNQINEGINKWNNKSMLISLSPKKLINKNKEIKCGKLLFVIY